VTGFPARLESHRQVASTNDLVRGWLDAGTPEVCVATADEQTAGRGRAGRSWIAPPGRALLLSVGFRPTRLAPERSWQLPAIVSLAMAGAAEREGGLRAGTIRLKWPNDLVTETGDGANPAGGAEGPAGAARVRKLGGVLGESEGLGTADPRVVVGVGLNVGWPRAEFPRDLAAGMTSLDEVAAGRPIDRAQLLATFLVELERRLDGLRAGRFPVADWMARQVTTGRLVLLHGHGREPEEVRAAGLDPASGALLVVDPGAPGGERAVHAGDVVHVRLATDAGATARV
jgi:BirA family biotin operon repressor/biotin-[acetyl-CoA-carboxylase] ligase